VGFVFRSGPNMFLPAATALDVDEGALPESFRVLLLKADDAAASLPTAALTSGLEALDAYGLDFGMPCFNPAETSLEVASEVPALERRSGRDEKYSSSKEKKASFSWLAKFANTIVKRGSKRWGSGLERTPNLKVVCHK